MHLLVAGLLGAMGWRRAPAPDDPRDFLTTQPGIEERRVGEGLPSVTLDFAELQRRHRSG